MRAEVGWSELERVSESGRLGELYRMHAGDAARLAYLVTGDRALAEDIVQEAFVRLYGRFRDLRNPDAFDVYLRRTVVNLARSHFRRRKVERKHAPKLVDEPAVDPVDLGERDRLWSVLQSLPERQRTAIVLRFYEDLSEVSTAEVMGCPVGTVKSLVSRGLERLRATLPRE
jgi:RNA polymerase sigma-70 factor (sigma-E family)